MKHEWIKSKYTGEIQCETPKHGENVIVCLNNGKVLPAWYDISGWFRGMQGGFIQNVKYWERLGESDD